MEEDKELRQQRKASLEAFLFAMGDAVECERMAAALEISTEEARELLLELVEEYSADTKGIGILVLGDKFQMCTKSAQYETLIKLCHVPKKHVLTEVLLETLSIIAYKQPVTKAEIEAIRGVKSDFAVNKLMEYHLVCELGRMDAPGRPILFGTTDDFLRSFGVSSLEDLPTVAPEQQDQFRQEALEEAEISEVPV